MLTHITREPLKLDIPECEVILWQCLGVAQSEGSMGLGFSFRGWKILAAAWYNYRAGSIKRKLNFKLWTGLDNYSMDSY